MSTYESKKKKKSAFTVDNDVTNSSIFDFIKGGINKRTTWSNLLDKISDVYGLSARIFETEADLVASDIRQGEYAIVAENYYGFYEIGSLAPNTWDVTLASGFVATLQVNLDLPTLETYDELRGLKSSAIPDGAVLKVITDGIAGDFPVKTGTVTDNGGTLIVFTDDSNRYAERIYSGDVNVLWFGAVADGATDDSLAIQNALDFVHDRAEKGAVYAPGGLSYAYSSDIFIGRGVTLYGDGYSTDFVGTGATIRITNTLSGTNIHSIVRDLRIRTTDTSTGLRVDGDNVGGAVTRWIVENVFLIKTSGKQGIGFSISGAWNNTIKGVYVSGWDVGLEIDLDGPDYSWGMNGSAWVGGQIEGNNTGLSINGGIGIDFTGVVIETNSTRGVDIDQARNVTFSSGCYFEGNGEDFRIGNTSACYNITIEKSYFNTTSPFNAYAINAVSCLGLEVSNNRFERYTAEPLLIAGSGVTGKSENNTKDSATTIGMVDVATNSADRFCYSNADYALKETTLTIASGAVTITSDIHRIDTEGAAASDQLQTINGGSRGMTLTISAASSSRTVTVQGGGNIATTGGGNMDLDNSSDIIQLVYSEVSGLWLANLLGNNGV